MNIEHDCVEAGGVVAKSILPALKAAAENSTRPLYFWAGFLSGVYTYAGASIGSAALGDLRELIDALAQETIARLETKQ